MQIGLSMMTAAGRAIDPVTLAREAEARGFDLLALTDRSHIPAAGVDRNGNPRTSPPANARTYDPFAALAAAAAVTSRLALCTGICLVVQRDPIHTAKQVATVDHLSGGRFLFGVGGGWDPLEVEHHGVPFKRRWKALRERVEAMKALWTQDEASYHGEFVRFERVWQWPKPVQQPHPPVLVGGDGPRTLQRVLRYGDEWLPTAGTSPERLRARMAELNQLAEEAGRGPVPVSMFGCPPDEATARAYQALGITRLCFRVQDKPEAEVLPALDAMARLRETLLAG